MVVVIIFLFVFTSVGSIELETQDEMKEVDISTPEPVNNPTDHPWPQQGYNAQHLGRSPYSTADNPGIEKWRFPAGDWCDGSPVIDSDGTIYFGSSDTYLYAIHPNGSLKWKFEAERGLGDFGSSPAIAEDGTIFISTAFGSYVQAVNPNGTEKWKRWTGDIDTSITLGDDGVLYYGYNGGIDALYPDGTLKWSYNTEDYVESTPAIDEEGIIYFGSHDHFVYALYPNGTQKWKFQTGNWVHGSPTIGPDGTIYIGSDDTNLYALYSNNGTMKWSCSVGSMRGSPSLDKNGNLYFGVWENKIYSVSPDGTINWEFPIGDHDGVWGSTAVISDDGTIYIGANIDIGMLGGGEIIALNPDGSLKWRKVLSNSLVTSSPVISEDGVIYICSSNDLIHPNGPGNLHAFGPVESNDPPETPTVDGETEGQINEWYGYQISSDDPDNNPISYFADWDDGTNSGWTEDFSPGAVCSLYHRWGEQGDFTIKIKVRDTFGLESDWAYLEVTMPVNQHSYSFPLLQRLLERFPNTFPILRYLME